MCVFVFPVCKIRIIPGTLPCWQEHYQNQLDDIYESVLEVKMMSSLDERIYLGLRYLIIFLFLF